MVTGKPTTIGFSRIYIIKISGDLQIRVPKALTTFGCRQYFFNLKGCREQIKVENTALVCSDAIVKPVF